MRCLFMASTLILLAGCQISAPEDVYQPTSTIRDIMDSIVDPSANQLWDSVAVTVDLEGLHESFPESDDEWAAVRRSAISLIEATNLLLMPGREVAESGATAEDSEIELEPAEIKALIEDDRDTWISHTHRFYDVVFALVGQIDNRDTEGFASSIENLDLACERCHLTYWYPNDEAARQFFEEEERLRLGGGEAPEDAR